MYEHISNRIKKAEKFYNFSAFFFALLQSLQIYRSILHMLFSVMKSLYFTNIMMFGSKGILTPLIPDCYVLCTLAILIFIHQ